MKSKFFIVFLSVLAVSLPARAATDTLTLAVAVEKQGETITLTVPSASPRKVFLVPDPDRLVVDVPAVNGRHSVTLPSSYKGKLLKAARFGQFDPKTSRFVFDLAKPVRVLSVRTEGKSHLKLIIDIVASIAPIEEKSGAQETSEQTLHVMSTRPAKTPKAAPLADATPAKGEKPLIVIDAGHGGVDPGTIGPDGTQEKDVVLQYAKALKAQLLKSGRYNVKLTRDDDRFIMLRRRVEIARQNKASLFISLHADSDPESMAHGLSVYSLSEKASDQEAEQLAARENKSDVLAGIDLSDERQDVADILISLAQRETNNRSATLGDLVVTSLDGKVVLLANSHRFAGFAVLKAPDIPSILIETGFLSNSSEERLLKSKTHREQVVEGIARGVDAYFSHKKKADGE